MSVRFAKGFSAAWAPLGFLTKISKTAARMEEALTNGPWLLGDLYTLADVIVTPLIDRIADLGLNYLWADDYPRVTYWYACMQARPAFATALYRGARLTEFLGIRH